MVVAVSGGGGSIGEGGGSEGCGGKGVAVAVVVEWCMAITVAVNMAVEVVRLDHLIPFSNIIPTYVGGQY